MTPERVTALAAELERMIQHSAIIWDETEGDDPMALLEDMEERVSRIAMRLRGQDIPPHTFHHPMPEEM